MTHSAVTISLVPEAAGGPFIFWDNLARSVRKAKELGFDAVEIFLPSADAIDPKTLRALLDENQMKLAAVGTGAGWLKHKLHLCLPDASDRRKARDFIRSIINFAGQFGAPAIVGSMQGRWGDVTRDTALSYLSEALNDLGEHAAQYRVPLLYEPLNRYETNIANTTEFAVAILQSLSTTNVKLLADLFHMNIEEPDIAASLKSTGHHIGHVHFVDSNRRPAGCGHIDFAAIATALNEINFSGYLSAEAFAYPDSDQAAKMTIQTYRRFFK